MEIRYKEDGKFDFIYTPKKQEHIEDRYYQPFKNYFDSNPITGTVDPESPYRHVGDISYRKREGGAYIYSNNPEMLADEDIGVALIRNTDMTGDFVFTYEHSNHTAGDVYLGYQLLNTSDADAVVTVFNLGFQTEGEWLGQRSWSDFYNYKLTLPDDYFLPDGSVNPVFVGCDYIDYTPRVFSPVTITIPAGKYVYILGGTTQDAYNHVNIGNTADIPIKKGRCSNGAVKFKVEGGSVQGTFYCYTDAAQVQANPPEQGYIVYRNGKTYGYQYKGTDYFSGLIESNISFIVHDKTANGRMPVKYVKEYDPDCALKNAPYQEYSPIKKEITENYWVTSLNPNNDPMAIGSDMVNFNTIDAEGKPITIDNNHADGLGNPANTGNWMVQYTDNITFINVGTVARKFRIYKHGSTTGSALLTIVRNENGEILTARMKANPYSFGSMDEAFAGVDKSLLVLKNKRYYFKVADGRPYIDTIDERAFIYEITVEPMSAERVSVDYLILGNSNGGIKHWVEVDNA
jgi:hypothetical protein